MCATLSGMLDKFKEITVLEKKNYWEKGSKEESKGIAGLGEHERVVERSQADRHLLWHRPGRSHLK